MPKVKGRRYSQKVVGNKIEQASKHLRKVRDIIQALREGLVIITAKDVFLDVVVFHYFGTDIPLERSYINEHNVEECAKHIKALKKQIDFNDRFPIDLSLTGQELVDAVRERNAKHLDWLEVSLLLMNPKEKIPTFPVYNPELLKGYVEGYLQGVG